MRVDWETATIHRSDKSGRSEVVLWAAAVVLAAISLAGCSASVSDADQPRAEPTITPGSESTRPVATFTPVLAPTPTPLPAAAEVVAATVLASGRFDLQIVAGDVAPIMFEGAFAAGAVELVFELSDFLEFADLADPSLGDDPLAAQASELLAGQWLVRVVQGQVFVQQEILVETAGGAPGDWVVVDDPLITDLVGRSGVFAGGLDHDVAVDIIRSAGTMMVATGAGEVAGHPVAIYETTIDGPALSARGLGAAETAALAGMADLHTVQTPAEVWLDDGGVLVMLMLDVSGKGFGAASAGAQISVHCSVGDDAVDLVVPDNIAGIGPA